MIVNLAITRDLSSEPLGPNCVWGAAHRRGITGDRCPTHIRGGRWPPISCAAAQGVPVRRDRDLRRDRHRLRQHLGHHALALLRLQGGPPAFPQMRTEAVTEIPLRFQSFRLAF
jgi:hypothetical protein